MEDLIVETIESYNSYMEKVPAGAEFIANSLREDNVNEALQAINNFSEGVLWLSEASELLKNNGVVVNLNIRKIQEFLIEINSGLEIQDYVLVADMFEYEIAPFFVGLEQVVGPVQ